MPANKHMRTTERKKYRLSLTMITRQFWSSVNRRLVKIHRVEPSSAEHAIRVYRRRVGNVAMNRGPVETAQDIASAIRGGGFAPIRRTAVVRFRGDKLTVA